MHWAALYRHRTCSRQLTAERGRLVVRWWAGRAPGARQLLPLAHGGVVRAAPRRGPHPGARSALPARRPAPLPPRCRLTCSAGHFRRAIPTQSCSGEGDASAVQPTMARDHSNGALAQSADRTLCCGQPTTGAGAGTCSASPEPARRTVPAAGSPPPPCRTYTCPVPIRARAGAPHSYGAGSGTHWRRRWGGSRWILCAAACMHNGRRKARCRSCSPRRCRWPGHAGLAGITQYAMRGGALSISRRRAQGAYIVAAAPRVLTKPYSVVGTA